MLDIWAVVPARSGSKGFPGKNIRPLAGVPLIGHAIAFAKRTGFCSRVLVSTDSAEYAAIGEHWGGWVPFLRSPEAAADHSMEEHILGDLDRKLTEHGIKPPDALIWLRPTFPFRRVADVQDAVSRMTDDVHSVRLVTDGEPRLYGIEDGWLTPQFNDGGRSMIRRQEFKPCYRVFHTDIFWYRNVRWGERFLGTRVLGIPVHKICAVDVDSAEDFEVAEAMIESGTAFINEYSAVAASRI